jgi:flavin-dependent dehydrogenase
MHTYLPIKYPFYDVIVIGARCAGASTAMLLASAGLRVLVIDRQPYGSDTLSTHALMRPAVVQLARWGLLEKIVAESTPVITATSFHYGGDDVVTVPVQGNARIPGLVAPRRTVLDRLLVDAAIEAGAEVVYGVVAQQLLHHRNGRVSGVRVRCTDGRVLSLNASWVVGADGLGSLVGREANARTLHRGRASAATIYVYTKNPGVDEYRWYFGKRCAAGIIPTNEDKMCVFVSTPAEETERPTHVSMTERHNAVLRRLVPSIAEHIAFTGCSMPRGFRGVPATIRQAYGPGWVLVGDAGLFRDPLTSHGISDALRDAEGAARAIMLASERELSFYEQERDALARPVIHATESICSFDWSGDQLKELHRQLSAAIKDEVAVLMDRPSNVSVSPDLAGTTVPNDDIRIDPGKRDYALQHSQS